MVLLAFTASCLLLGNVASVTIPPPTLLPEISIFLILLEIIDKLDVARVVFEIFSILTVPFPSVGIEAESCEFF